MPKISMVAGNGSLFGPEGHAIWGTSIITHMESDPYVELTIRKSLYQDILDEILNGYSD
jgi:hypothetical protein